MIFYSKPTGTFEVLGNPSQSCPSTRDRSTGFWAGSFLKYLRQPGPLCFRGQISRCLGVVEEICHKVDGLYHQEMINLTQVGDFSSFFFFFLFQLESWPEWEMNPWAPIWARAGSGRGGLVGASKR